MTTMHPYSLDDLNGLSDKYIFVINSYGNIEVYTKDDRLVGCFDDIDTLIDTGLG